MNKAKVASIAVVGLALLGGALSLAVPAPLDKSWLSFHIYFGLAIMVSTLFVGSSVLFMMGLDGFSSRLKRSYAFLCVGLGLFGLAQLQLPSLLALGQLDGLWKKSGIIVLPYLAGLIAMFIGTRSFAKLFDIKNITTNPWFVFLTPLGLGFLVAFVPHVYTATPELEYDVANVFAILTDFIMLMATLHVFQIKRVASAAYAGALAWLGLAFATLVGVATIHLLAVFVTQDSQADIISAAVLVPFLVTAGFLMLSAFAFNRISVAGSVQPVSIARNFFGKPVGARREATATSVDIVIYEASLVSNTQTIHRLLGPLRQITARVKINQSTSATDESALMDIYLQIEHYLIEQEPIRKFTRGVLRQQIANSLKLTTGAHDTFWSKLP